MDCRLRFRRVLLDLVWQWGTHCHDRDGGTIVYIPIGQMTQWQRHYCFKTTSPRRFDAIMTLWLRRVSSGKQVCAVALFWIWLYYQFLAEYVIHLPIFSRVASLMRWQLHDCPRASAVTKWASSNENIFRVTGPLYGEFTGHQWIPVTKPVTRSFGIFFDLRLT